MVVQRGSVKKRSARIGSNCSARRGEEIALGFEHCAGRSRVRDTEPAASVTSRGERLTRRDESERVGARPHVPLVSRSDARNVEPLDLCNETSARIFGIERANRRKPAFARHEPAERDLGAYAERGHDTDARDGDTFERHRIGVRTGSHFGGA